MESINSEFFDLVQNGTTPSDAYKRMVNKNSYRIFADPNYDCNEPADVSSILIQYYIIYLLTYKCFFQSQPQRESMSQPFLASQSILQDWASDSSNSVTAAAAGAGAAGAGAGCCTNPPSPTSSITTTHPPTVPVSRMSSVSLPKTLTQSNSNNPFSDFSAEESDFIQLLVNAKTLADMNENPVHVEWRGYETLVQPNLPPFSKIALRERLNSALQHIQVFKYSLL